MEDLVVRSWDPAQLAGAYEGKRVLVTGHTGFKGGWLTLWLTDLGAEVTGYSLAPRTTPALFEVANIGDLCESVIADIDDEVQLRTTLRRVRPDFVFHLAAQALVRRGHEEPILTIETNVLGTARVLEAVRQEALRCCVVVVTSDKCYAERDAPWGFREDEPLGGNDVYSMTKGAAELVSASYRHSFFPPERLASHGVAIATARAGNVVGGGDWAQDRLLPDAVVALAKRLPIRVRNPGSVRPWQHVLEPVGGYMLLGARLAGFGTDRPGGFCEAWNFGPRTEDACSVKELVEKVVAEWGEGRWVHEPDSSAPPEAAALRLSVEKAYARLGWAPAWPLGGSIARTVEWYKAFYRGSTVSAVDLMRRQIAEYAAAVSAKGRGAGAG